MHRRHACAFKARIVRDGLTGMKEIWCYGGNDRDANRAAVIRRANPEGAPPQKKQKQPLRSDPVTPEMRC